MQTQALTSTEHFNLDGRFPFTMGKVRDIYDLGDKLLIVTTDRVSAFDHVLSTPIPGRGTILTQMTIKWSDYLRHTVSKINTYLPITDQMASTDIDCLPAEFQPYAEELDGRFMIVDKCATLPIEYIIRGNITGSMWKAYQKALKENPNAETVNILGHELPAGLQESQEFPEPLFTPSTKAEAGQHDENISYKQMEEILQKWLFNSEFRTLIPSDNLSKACEELTISIFKKARDYAKAKGIIIADTKIELGLKIIDGKLWLVIIDEVFTSDSSRYWPVDEFVVGQSQNSFDKQIIRDYLSKVLKWDKQLPAPELPAEIVKQTIARYKECMTILFPN